MISIFKLSKQWFFSSIWSILAVNPLCSRLLFSKHPGERKTWPNQSQQYPGHSTSYVIDVVQVGCPCTCDPERHRLGRRPLCEIYLSVLDNEARLCEHRIYL